jgi:hypothetical protein
LVGSISVVNVFAYVSMIVGYGGKTHILAMQIIASNSAFPPSGRRGPVAAVKFVPKVRRHTRHAARGASSLR